MTGKELKKQILTQIQAVEGIGKEISKADDTPVNQNNYQLYQRARAELMGVYDITPDTSTKLTETQVRSYNNANAHYKSLRSTFAEFGNSKAPSFGNAVYESVKELPKTLTNAGKEVGGAVGDAVGGVTSFALETVKQSLKGFFAGFGWFGWLLVGIAAFAAIMYFVPGVRSKMMSFL